ncbi:MAG: HIT domain-containing protein [Acidimicrobiales bacterium]
MSCLFCQIVAGEIPSTEVYASPLSYAFRDLNPQAPTHVLIVPRAHITNADTIVADDAAAIADLFVTAQAVARQEGLLTPGVDPADDGGYRLVFNVGEITGNTVPHLHLHILGGRRFEWPPG